MKYRDTECGEDNKVTSLIKALQLAVEEFGDDIEWSLSNYIEDGQEIVIFNKSGQILTITDD